MFLKVTNPLEKCHLKFASDAGEFAGYASVFDSNDSVNDTIVPGAFQKSLESGRSVKMFVNHAQHEVPIGDWVEMKEDERGLYAVGKIDLNHKDGPTVYSALKRGAMDGISIGFTMGDGDWESKNDRGRLIKNVNLMEASIVNFPCEGQARISAVKADVLGLETLKDYEDYLRDVGGFSRSVAKALVGQASKIVRADAENELKQIKRQANADALEILKQLKSKM